MKDFRNATVSGIIVSRPTRGVDPNGDASLVFRMRSELEYGVQNSVCYAKITEFSERDLQEGRAIFFCGRFGIRDQYRVDYYRTFEIPKKQDPGMSGEAPRTASATIKQNVDVQAEYIPDDVLQEHAPNPDLRLHDADGRVVGDERPEPGNEKEPAGPIIVKKRGFNRIFGRKVV